MTGLGSFAQYGTVSEASVVKVDDDLPLSRACLLGCGITTGWGSAVNTADVTPGDTVVVIGCGGIGAGAIQGARLAGAENIVVVEIVEDKRDKAFQFGATHFVTSMPEAMALVADLTRGVMADSALLTVGLVKGPMIGEALDIVRKGGAVVMTAIASMADVTPTLPMAMMTLFQKRLLGSLYGEANPRADIPAAPQPLPRRQAAPRRDGHQRVQAQRHQRGLRRHARGPQHPWRDHPRPLKSLREQTQSARNPRRVGYFCVCSPQN